MSGTKVQKKRHTIAFDSSILIYHANAHPEFGLKAKKQLEPVAQGKSHGILSVVAVTEMLNMGKKSAHNQKTFNRLHTWLFGLTNISFIEITAPIAIKAARLQQRYEFKTPDALHIACAIESNADVFITNDKQLQSCKEIPVRIL